MADLAVGLNFRYNFRFKNAPEAQNGGHLSVCLLAILRENDWTDFHDFFRIGAKLPVILRMKKFAPALKFRHLLVCLSVRLFVCYSHDTGRAVRAINTKLLTYMYLGSGQVCVGFCLHDVIDDVSRSINRSNFDIPITRSIFKLERRSKAQNVGHALGLYTTMPLSTKSSL